MSDNGKGSLCELLRLEGCVFRSILETYSLIRHKKVNGKMTLSIVKDQLSSFVTEYDMINIEINKPKVTLYGMGGLRYSSE